MPILSGCYMKFERDSEIWKDYDYRNPVPPVNIPETGHQYYHDNESYYTPPKNYRDYYEQFYQDNDASYVPPSGYGCTSDNIGSFGCD